MLMRTRHAPDNCFGSDYIFDDKPGKNERDFTYTCRCPDAACDQKRSSAWRKTKTKTEIKPGHIAS